MTIFALKREDVSQEGFNALVHRCPQDAGPDRGQIIDREALDENFVQDRPAIGSGPFAG